MLAFYDFNMLVVSLNSLLVVYPKRETRWRFNMKAETVKSYLLPLLHGKHGSTGSGTGPPHFSMQNSRTFKATNTTNFLHRAAKTTGVSPMQGGGTRMLSKLATSLRGPDCSSGSQTRAQTCCWWEEHLYSGLWRHTPEGLTSGSRAAPFWPGDHVHHIGRLLADCRRSHSKVCYFRSGSHTGLSKVSWEAVGCPPTHLLSIVYSCALPLVQELNRCSV